MIQDRRRLPFDGEIALESLRGQVKAARFAEGTRASVLAFSCPLNRTREGGLDKELLHGEAITIIAEHNGISFVQSGADGYCGYTETRALGPHIKASHRVTARATHAYARSDFKSPPLGQLSFNACVEVSDIQGQFAQTTLGWLPLQHLTAIDAPGTDPTSYAERFLGTPYLWGGNTGFGIDCSGLVQAAHLACGIECPRDSDMQEAEFGTPLPVGAPLQRGDLVFWKGHVGILRDPKTLLHANAHHMMTATEPLGAAIERIGAREFGAVTSFKRLG